MTITVSGKRRRCRNLSAPVPVCGGSAASGQLIGKAPRQDGMRTSNSLPSGSARHVHGTFAMAKVDVDGA
jgi:hypothetical protein